MLQNSLTQFTQWTFLRKRSIRFLACLLMIFPAYNCFYFDTSATPGNRQMSFMKTIICLICKEEHIFQEDFSHKALLSHGNILLKNR